MMNEMSDVPDHKDRRRGRERMRDARSRPPQDDRYSPQDTALESEADYSPEEGRNSAVPSVASAEDDLEADLGGPSSGRASPGQSSSAAKELQKGLLQMYRKKQFTDVSIRVGRAMFRCHRVVLCAMSTFFHRLLSEDDTDRRLVIFQNADAGVFEEVLEYIYTGKFVIGDNFGDFLKLVMKLEMSSLAGKMDSFLEDNMKPDNCIQIWRQAGKMKELANLEAKASRYILNHFFHEDITDQLKDLTLPELIHILEHDDLPADNEEMVVRRGLDWLKALKVRAADAGDLFQRLHLPLTSLEFIRKEVDILDAIKDNETCRKVVAEAMTYLSNPERRHEFHSTRIAFRKHNPFREVLVVYAGYKFGGDKAMDVVALNLKTGEWHSLAPIVHHPGKGMATAVYDNDIYITGGTRDPQAYWKYISKTNRWKQGPALITGRKDHCMEVLTGGVVCVFGGYEPEEDDEYEEEPALEVETLGPGDTEWRGVISLMLPIRHAASCVTTDGSKIYVYGGRMSDGSPTDSLQCLDFKTRACSLIATSLPVACAGAIGMRTYSSYFLFTTTGQLMRFDADNAKLLSEDQVLHFKRKRFCIAVHHDKLLVVAGEDGEQVYRDMVCVLLNEAKIQLVPWKDFVPPVRTHFGLAKLILPRESLGEPLW